MTIDHSIALQAQPSNPLNALAQGYQLGNSIRQQPMLDKINRQKLDAGEIDIQNAKLKQQEAVTGMAKAMLQSDYYGAEQIAPYLDAGDMDAVTRTIEQRKQAKAIIGMPTDTEDNFLAQLQKDPNAAKGALAKVLENGRRIFGKAQSQAKPQIYKDDSGTWALMPDGTKQRLGGLPPQVSQQGPDPYFSVVDTTQGKMIFNNRTGKFEMATGADGKPLLSAAVDPDNKRNVNAAGAFGTAQGKGDAEAIAGLGGAISKAETALSRISELRKHEGRSFALGYASMLPGVPGTKQMDFIKRLEELKGGAFLQAFESLKGGGQITQVEGDKATQAITRMDRALSPEDFDQALNDFEEVVKAGMERAKASAARSSNRQDQTVPDGTVPPASEQPATTENMQPNIQEGATATNPQTGQKIIFRGGKWQAL